MTGGVLRDPVLRISLRQLSGPVRLAVVIILSAIPVIITGIIVGTGGGQGDGLVGGILNGLLATVILPIVTMALATTAFGNELEDKTLGYLVLKPVSRLRIVVPKFAVIVLMAGPLLVLSGVVTALISFDADARAAAAVGVGIAVGSVVYSSVFMWLGLMTTRALGFALLYVFLWEGVLATFLEGIRFLSIRSYTLSIMYGIDDVNLAALDGSSIGLAAAAAGAGIVTAVFFLLTLRRLRTMDVP